MDWCIFEATSIEDAWDQGNQFDSGTHPDQDRLIQTASLIRNTYLDSAYSGLELFQREFPSSPRPVVVKLEAIGDDARQFFNDLNGSIYGKTMFGNEDKNPFRRPWVADITGNDPKYKFKRSFLRGRKDYSEANKKGSRGVYYYYELDPGRVYEINELTSSKNTRRFFARVADGQLIEIDEMEVKSCLNEVLE
ncbi:hypothetical protein [Paenibacillus sp. Pae108]|uniref:hypothetical protein n=1 Tax=Paenibacillus sp. Pae108 TaxID=2926019 RepID=UPI00211971AA|nr:hypothetical protein [Paenibacillus sp. Pae108]